MSIQNVRFGKSEVLTSNRIRSLMGIGGSGNQVHALVPNLIYMQHLLEVDRIAFRNDPYPTRWV